MSASSITGVGDVGRRRAAIAHLWDLPGDASADRAPYLYCVLDAARDRQIHPRLRQLAAGGVEILPLYQGAAASELAAVGPYLVALGTDLDVFDWVWSEGWGESWGIWLWSLVVTERLRSHLRTLTMVRTEDARHLLFRFYDPRVLRTVLPLLDARQSQQVFGPVQHIFAESEDGAALLRFSLDDDRTVSSARLSL